MNNGYFATEKILNDHVTATAKILNLACGKIGEPLAESHRGQVWLQPYNLIAEATPATVGNQGEDNIPGVLQIDVCGPENAGQGALLKVVDSLLPHLEAGKHLAYNGAWVKLRSNSLSRVRQVGGFKVYSLSISYYTRRQRT